MPLKKYANRNPHSNKAHRLLLLKIIELSNFLVDSSYLLDEKELEKTKIKNPNVSLKKKN